MLAPKPRFWGRARLDSPRLRSRGPEITGRWFFGKKKASRETARSAKATGDVGKANSDGTEASFDEEDRSFCKEDWTRVKYSYGRREGGKSRQMGTICFGRFMLIASLHSLLSTSLRSDNSDLPQFFFIHFSCHLTAWIVDSLCFDCLPATHSDHLIFPSPLSLHI